MNGLKGNYFVFLGKELMLLIVDYVVEEIDLIGEGGEGVRFVVLVVFSCVGRREN